MFRLSMNKVEKRYQNQVYFQYKIEKLAAHRGGRLRFNGAEWLYTYLNPSERDMDFSSACKIIDTAINQIKKSGSEQIFTGKKLSKLSFLYCLKRLIDQSIKENQYKQKAKDLFNQYVMAVSKKSQLVINIMTETAEIYDFVDQELLKAWCNVYSTRCYTKVFTTHDAIMFWHDAEPDLNKVKVDDTQSRAVFDDIKRIIIQLLLSCKNTSEMERSFSLLHNRTTSTSNFETARDSIFLRQLKKNKELFINSEKGKPILRNGSKNVLRRTYIQLILNPFQDCLIEISKFWWRSRTLWNQSIPNNPYNPMILKDPTNRKKKRFCKLSFF